MKLLLLIECLSESKIACRKIVYNIMKQFCFLYRVFLIIKTKINQQNAQINSG